MGIDMYVSEARTQADSVATRCDSRVKGYENLQKAISDFYFNSQGLSGKTYDSAKEYFMSVLYPLAQGGALLSEATKEAVKRFPEEYTARVDTCDWKESELIEKLTQIDQQIRTLYDIRSNIEYYPMPDLIKTTLLYANEEQIQLYQDMHNVFSEKLDRLREFNASSPDIFSEIDALESSIKQGLAQVKSSWNASSGTFMVSQDLSWTNLVRDKWKSREDKLHGVDEKKNKELEKYNVKALIYTDSDGNPKVLWLIEDKETGYCIDNPKLYQYLSKTGQYLDLDNVDFITFDVYQEKQKAAWRKGANYITGDQYNGALGTIISTSQHVEDVATWLNETEVGQAIQMLGFTYASYKITTASGTKQINNIPVGENAGNHLKNVEGVGRNGISGGHNSEAFLGSLDEIGGKVVSETPHSNIPGIKDIAYEIPKKGIDGQPRVPAEYKIIDQPKTVYDPNIISDKQMYEWGQEAMKNGKIVDNKIYGTASNGLKFEGFYRNGEITNFFPVLK
ncbi:hypothetical protein FACS1894192_03840 [Bacilli bacterium]|nr:hypothetical protein FACS1894192_03840 [Bacilli bacterium]